jgi:hypothetical protein
MHLRFARTLLIGMLLLQCGVLAPAAMTLDSGRAMADCAERMGSSADCPCCPKDASTSAGCLAVCLGVSAGMPELAGISTPVTASPDLDLPSDLLASQTYTPVNPPPIG